MTHTLTLFTHRCCHSRIGGSAHIKEALRSVKGLIFEERDFITDSRLAKAAGARLSPTLVLDGKVLCVGLPGADEIKRMIQDRLEKQ